MAIVDIFIILIFTFSILMGFYRGVIWEFLKYVAFAISSVLSGFVLLKSSKIINESDYPLAIGATIGIFIFVSILIITLGIANWISKQLRNTGFASSDRILGFLFGFIRAALFTLLLYSGLMLISRNVQPDWMKESMFVNVLNKGHKSIEKLVYSINSPKLNRLLNLDKTLKDIGNLITDKAVDIIEKGQSTIIDSAAKTDKNNINS